jgi:hypothetical protein
MPSPAEKKAFFLSSFLVALGLFALANAALGKLPAVSGPKLAAESFEDSSDAMKNGRPASWWISRAYLKQPSAPDVVLFGSSQMGGVQAADAKMQGRRLDWVLDHDCRILQNALDERLDKKTSVFICGLPGAMISDHYVISKSLFPANKPGLVIVTVAPRDFIDNFLPDVNATEPYKFFSRYLSHDPAARKLLFTTLNDQLEQGVASIVPVKNVAGLIPWKQIEDSLPLPSHLVADKKIPATGWMFSLNSDNDNVKPGQCVVLPVMPSNYVDNSVEYAKRYRNCNPPFYRREVDYLKALLDFGKQENIKVLVVDMPLTPVNRSLLPPVFWTSYKIGLKQACSTADAEYLDLSADPAFLPSDFVDTVHLNAGGGTKLINRIAHVVSQNPRLCEAFSKRAIADVNHLN